MDRSPDKINRQALELKGIIDQRYPTDSYRIFHPNTIEYTFFSVAYGNVVLK